ncbi:MraY family glycosyltransferase [Noviherbaspirillum pedocola]|uniref:Glycosyltransferase family 4 protein n=1 Tax=Noviherbaspirillum pedocola TaxID=2801341 RepID=A0A934T158_9BURK|nr:glycosyltransferase [Noviherbaspirillum pedocola]MBK4736709.1 glycosyltransferase family 4 protein [Noviherbaspirillum pedocola]
MMHITAFIEGALVAALVSFFTSRLIVVTQNWHGALSLDCDLAGKQKFHTVPVPRVGGLALMLGMVCGFAWIRFLHADVVPEEVMSGALWMSLSALPVFMIGLIEDATKKVSVRARLFFTAGGAMLAAWAVGAVMPRVDLWLIDDLLAYAPAAIAVTVFAVVGVTNSVNIIDGFNGIAASTVVVMLAGMALLGWQAGDALIVNLSLLGMGAALGFLLVNYPRGKLFMGDGGAYVLGFWCAEVAVLAIRRNASIDAWQVLAIYAYPVIEVLYSIYRKKMVRRMSPAIPDRLHLHMLVYRRFICQKVARRATQPWMRNAAVVLVIAPWTMLFTAAAVILGPGMSALFLVAAQVGVYMVFYTRLVRGHWCFDPKVMLGLAPEARGNPA